MHVWLNFNKLTSLLGNVGDYLLRNRAKDVIGMLYQGRTTLHNSLEKFTLDQKFLNWNLYKKKNNNEILK